MNSRRTSKSNSVPNSTGAKPSKGMPRLARLSSENQSLKQLVKRLEEELERTRQAYKKLDTEYKAFHDILAAREWEKVTDEQLARWEAPEYDEKSQTLDQFIGDLERILKKRK